MILSGIHAVNPAMPEYFHRAYSFSFHVMPELFYRASTRVLKSEFPITLKGQ